MHPYAYLYLFILVILLEISYIAKDNSWLNNIFKTKFKKISFVTETHIFSVLIYFSIAYIYLFEGYLKKISYIYDDTKNTDEDKQDKLELKYELIFGYIIFMIVLFVILKKVMNKH